MMSAMNTKMAGNPGLRKKSYVNNTQLKNSRLRKQMSEEIRHSYSSGTLGTPNIVKPKASLISSKVNFESDIYHNDYTEDSSYLVVEAKNSRVKRSEGEPDPYTQVSELRKERSTITPSRSAIRNRIKPLQFTSDAFQQP